MKCHMCGCEFDETKLENRGCAGCGKHGCKQVHCPNSDLEIIRSLKKNSNSLVNLKMNLN